MSSIKIEWQTLGLSPKDKSFEISLHSTNIRIEWGGWYDDRDIYLWWNEFGIEKCKKLVSTKQRVNMKHFKYKTTIL